MPLPGDFVAKFQAIAAQRLARIEQAWAQLLGRVDDRAASTLHRELHTLKGEAQIVGMDQVALVSHKLEDLFILARDRGYAIDDELDLMVNISLKFIGTLTRRTSGAGTTGLDIPTFLRQIDGVVRDSKRGFVPLRTQTGVAVPLSREDTGLSLRARNSLATPAIEAYIEYASATSIRRNRLRAAWHTMRDLAGIHRATLGADQLQKQVLGADTAARATGKQISVEVDVPTLEVTSRVLTAVDVAALHLIRNAIDHGVGTPAERIAAGKAPTGTIRIKGQITNDLLVVTISDDGRGIDFAKVHARAVELELVAPGADILREKWVEILCQPGFSTRDTANDISGRGFGLDVVREQILGLGGTLDAESERGVGTTWTMRLPVPPLVVTGVTMKLPALPFPVMLDRWSVIPPPPDLNELFVFDAARMLGFPEPTAPRPNLVAFARDNLRMAIACDTPPRLIQANRLVNGGPKAMYEVVVTDREVLLLHPELIVG
ncbi:MAG TPA: ATP-binding protein [Kofleriaceae bacterium]|jgi:signal transduction histidine kinase